MSRVSIPKKLRHQLYFSRPELSQILAAYSARVAAGEWRDYAIDHLAGSATFSIFRHTHENPLFVIEKKQHHPKERRNSSFATATGCFAAPALSATSSAISTSCRVSSPVDRRLCAMSQTIRGFLTASGFTLAPPRHTSYH